MSFTRIVPISKALFLGCLAVVFLLAPACAQSGDKPASPHETAQAPPPPPPVLDPPVAGKAPANTFTQAQIDRGKFLVTIGGCNDCHTPWGLDKESGLVVPDVDRMLSGHPDGAPGPANPWQPGELAVIGPTFTSFALPFGTVFAPNLTPDVDTGTGTWTPEMFVKIFRTGTHLGGGQRPVLPPMPFAVVATLSDDDLVSMFAYLRSIPPIHNGVPTLNPPQEVQDGVKKWNEFMLRRQTSPAGAVAKTDE